MTIETLILSNGDKMRKKIFKIWIFCSVICLAFAVSSCKKQTPANVTAQETKAPAGIVVLESESNIDENGQKAEFEVNSDLPSIGEKPVVKEASDDFWNIDFESARNKAAKEKKDILVNFSGTKWCPPCKQLEAEVFNTEEFRTEVSKKYVPVLLDFPRDASKASKQNQRLSQEFGHQYFPTVYLTDSSGRAYAKIGGYVPGGPKAYLQKIEELGKVKVQFAELMATVEKDEPSDVEKAKRIEKAILLVDPELLPQFYRDEVNRIVALDKDNAAGLKEKYGFDSLMWQIVDLQIAGDFAGALKLVNASEKEMKLNSEQSRQLQFMKAGIQYRLDDKDGSIKSILSMTDNATEEEAMSFVFSYVQAIPDVSHVSKTIDAAIEHLKYKDLQLQQMLYMKSQALYGLKDKEGSLKSLKAALDAAPEGPTADQIKKIIAEYFSDPEQK